MFGGGCGCGEEELKRRDTGRGNGFEIDVEEIIDFKGDGTGVRFVRKRRIEVRTVIKIQRGTTVFGSTTEQSNNFEVDDSSERERVL
ncbi:hypothetical protein U1Q18_000168, partial [Sarracenia purpurea var. burkii]